MTTISIRLNDQDKRELDRMCADMGMNLSTFFTIYVKKALQERKIPFEISAPADPFESEANLKWLDESWRQIREGRVVTRTLDELEAMTRA